MRHFIRVCTVCWAQTIFSHRYTPFHRNFDWHPLKTQNGLSHTYCIYIFGKKSTRMKSITKYWAQTKIYSASMKSYQYRNFDVSENIQYSSLATVTFMFLVNDTLVWRDKTVTRALELWCTWCTCILCFSQFLRIWNRHVQETTCQDMR